MADIIYNTLKDKFEEVFDSNQGYVISIVIYPKSIQISVYKNIDFKNPRFKKTRNTGNLHGSQTGSNGVNHDIEFTEKKLEILNKVKSIINNKRIEIITYSFVEEKLSVLHGHTGKIDFKAEFIYRREYEKEHVYKYLKKINED